MPVIKFILSRPALTFTRWEVLVEREERSVNSRMTQWAIRGKTAKLHPDLVWYEKKRGVS
jgi:hypothetical protein